MHNTLLTSAELFRAFSTLHELGLLRRQPNAWTVGNEFLRRWIDDHFSELLATTESPRTNDSPAPGASPSEGFEQPKSGTYLPRPSAFTPRSLETELDLFHAVSDFFHEIRHLVEQDDGHRLLTAVCNGQPGLRSEEETQIALKHWLRPMCQALNIDLERETLTSRGLLDFKFALGRDKRCLVEVKLFHSSRIQEGVEFQLPIYLLAEKAHYGIYVPIIGQGLLVQGHGEYSLQQTEQAIARGEQLLFEAAFCFDQVLVRCDILHQLPSGAWEIVEVKSATGVRQHDIADLAVQWYVVAGHGLAVTSARLMHLSRSGQPDALFAIHDMSAAVQSLLPEVLAWLQAIRDDLARPTLPDVPIGPHCDRPHPCPARALCWRDVPTLSIFSIPGLNSEIKQGLARQQRYGLEHVEAHHALSKPQRQQVDRWRRGEPQIDTAAIHRRLASLAHPIHFLDFETIAFALPRFSGTRPYDQIPFQYSCHVLRATGQLVHHEFLHGLASDPRPALAAALVEAIGPEGSVVAFNASFERSVLQALAAALPTYAPALRSIAERLWDQLNIFRLHYFEPRFGGSNSIKNVLPVLVPELDYADLAIRQGDDAQAAWLAMLETADPVQRQQHAADLRAYCQRDTLAMVAIHQALLRLAPAADPPS